MNIYVGNFPKTIDDEAIRNLFSAHGEVTEVKLLKDRYTGELRGFGFVIMDSKDDALKAIEAINGSELEGRKLVVNEARPKRDNRGGGGGGRGGFRGGGGGGGGGYRGGGGGGGGYRGGGGGGGNRSRY